MAKLTLIYSGSPHTMGGATIAPQGVRAAPAMAGRPSQLSEGEQPPASVETVGGEGEVEWGETGAVGGRSWNRGKSSD